MVEVLLSYAYLYLKSDLEKQPQLSHDGNKQLAVICNQRFGDRQKVLGEDKRLDSKSKYRYNKIFGETLDSILRACPDKTKQNLKRISRMSPIFGSECVDVYQVKNVKKHKNEKNLYKKSDIVMSDIKHHSDITIDCSKIKNQKLQESTVPKSFQRSIALAEDIQNNPYLDHDFVECEKEVLESFSDNHLTKFKPQLNDVAENAMSTPKSNRHDTRHEIKKKITRRVSRGHHEFIDSFDESNHFMHDLDGFVAKESPQVLIDENLRIDLKNFAKSINNSRVDNPSRRQSRMKDNKIHAQERVRQDREKYISCDNGTSNDKTNNFLTNRAAEAIKNRCYHGINESNEFTRDQTHKKVPEDPLKTDLKNFAKSIKSPYLGNPSKPKKCQDEQFFVKVISAHGRERFIPCDKDGSNRKNSDSFYVNGNTSSTKKNEFLHEIDEIKNIAGEQANALASYQETVISDRLASNIRNFAKSLKDPFNNKHSENLSKGQGPHAHIERSKQNKKEVVPFGNLAKKKNCVLNVVSTFEPDSVDALLAKKSKPEHNETLAEDSNLRADMGKFIRQFCPNKVSSSNDKHNGTKFVSHIKQSETGCHSIKTSVDKISNTNRSNSRRRTNVHCYNNNRSLCTADLKNNQTSDDEITKTPQRETQFKSRQYLHNTNDNTESVTSCQKNEDNILREGFNSHGQKSKPEKSQINAKHLAKDRIGSPEYESSDGDKSNINDFVDKRIISNRRSNDGRKVHKNVLNGDCNEIPPNSKFDSLISDEECDHEGAENNLSSHNSSAQNSQMPSRNPESQRNAINVGNNFLEINDTINSLPDSAASAKHGRKSLETKARSQINKKDNSTFIEPLQNDTINTDGTSINSNLDECKENLTNNNICNLKEQQLATKMPENHNKDNHQFSQNRNPQFNKSQTFQKENKISDKEVQVEMVSEIASTSNFELSKPFSAIKISERNNKDKQQFSQNPIPQHNKSQTFQKENEISEKEVQVEMVSEIANTSNFELNKPFSAIKISESNNKDNQQFSQNPNPQLNKSLTFQKVKEISEKEVQVEMVSEVVSNSTSEHGKLDSTFFSSQQQSIDNKGNMQETSLGEIQKSENRSIQQEELSNKISSVSSKEILKKFNSGSAMAFALYGSPRKDNSPIKNPSNSAAPEKDDSQNDAFSGENHRRKQWGKPSHNLLETSNDNILKGNDNRWPPDFKVSEPQIVLNNKDTTQELYNIPKENVDISSNSQQGNVQPQMHNIPPIDNTNMQHPGFENSEKTAPAMYPNYPILLNYINPINMIHPNVFMSNVGCNDARGNVMNGFPPSNASCIISEVTNDSSMQAAGSMVIPNQNLQCVNNMIAPFQKNVTNTLPSVIAPCYNIPPSESVNSIENNNHQTKEAKELLQVTNVTSTDCDKIQKTSAKSTSDKPEFGSKTFSKDGSGKDGCRLAFDGRVCEPRDLFKTIRTKLTSGRDMASLMYGDNWDTKTLDTETASSRAFARNANIQKDCKTLKNYAGERVGNELADSGAATPIKNSQKEKIRKPKGILPGMEDSDSR
ncbi:uncharacterized protein CDAR_73341 [Caerostris darwini]|uniref:Uncharacterized protein n=1 Tax=Caerostris darwini TaxID=1538125 RepID=A0AAV4VLG1_9ARAC|nr:uncharacterized protein CDAR_73341 [Caerostris darwini]